MFSVYVDVSNSQCNDLNMILGSSGIGQSITTRTWSIRVTQYSCNYANLAPSGCTEYFYGSDTDTITNYNYAGGTHLNDQFQKTCIRREKGNCRIRYTTQTAYSDFGISGTYTCNLYVRASILHIGFYHLFVSWKSDGHQSGLNQTSKSL